MHGQLFRHLSLSLVREVGKAVRFVDVNQLVRYSKFLQRSADDTDLSVLGVLGRPESTKSVIVTTAYSMVISSKDVRCAFEVKPSFSHKQLLISGSHETH